MTIKKNDNNESDDDREAVETTPFIITKKQEQVVKEELQDKEIMWMKVKRETTISNILALFLAPTATVTAGAYLNTNMPYLLQDPDYFNVPFD